MSFETVAPQSPPRRESVRKSRRHSETKGPFSPVKPYSAVNPPSSRTKARETRVALETEDVRFELEVDDLRFAATLGGLSTPRGGRFSSFDSFFLFVLFLFFSVLFTFFFKIL